MSSAERPSTVVIYGRVSDDRGSGTSVDDQVTEMQEWPTLAGLTVLAVERDDGISASQFAAGKVRPGWQKVMDWIGSGQVGYLAVWELSRATRDRGTYVSLIDACKDQGVILVIDDKIRDPRDPDDGHWLDLQVAAAVLESGKTSKRAHKGVRSKVRKARAHGRHKYGYRTEHSPTTGQRATVLDPARADVVREMATRMLAGESAYAIASDLNGRGIRTAPTSLQPDGAEWTPSKISRLLQSPTYARLRIHQGKVIADKVADWPEILTPEQHHRLVALFANPERRTNKEGNANKHLLSGLLVCGQCGVVGGRVIQRKLKDGTRSPRYSCRDQFCYTRNQAPVDAMVNAAMVRILSSPAFLPQLAASANDAEVHQARAELAQWEAEWANAQSQYERDEISLNVLGMAERKCLAKIEDAKVRAQPKHIPDAVYRLAGQDAATRWFAAPLSVRRSAIKALITVTILPLASGRNGNSAFDPASVAVAQKF